MSSIKRELAKIHGRPPPRFPKTPLSSTFVNRLIEGRGRWSPWVWDFLARTGTGCSFEIVLTLSEASSGVFDSVCQAGKCLLLEPIGW
jgi:hypothetical protein